MIPIVIPAAGKSSRMRGSDKLMQQIDDVPLLRRTVLTALHSGVGPVFVTLPAPTHPRQTALIGLDATIIPVPDAGEGMNASLRRAVTKLPQSSQAAMILLADLPDLSADDLRKVSKSIDLKPDYCIWRGATEDGKPGHPVIFSAALFPEIARLTGRCRRPRSGSDLRRAFGPVTRSERAHRSGHTRSLGQMAQSAGQTIKRREVALSPF